MAWRNATKVGEEIGPDRAAEIFSRYSGRRQLLGALNEHRLAGRMALDQDILILDVVPHTNQRGADIYFINLKEMRPGMADSKASVSGMNINGSSAFSPARWPDTIQQMRNKLRFALEDGRITPQQLRAIERNMRRPELVIGTGGASSVSDDVLAAVKNGLEQNFVNLMVDVRRIELD